MRGTLQNTFTNTIRPASISHLRESAVFHEFMKYFDKDCDVFVATHGEVATFVKHYKIIQRELQNRKFLSSFLGRIIFHSKLRDYKISAVENYLSELYDGYKERLKAICDALMGRIGRKISFPIERKDLEALTEEEKNLVLEAEREIQLSHIQFVGLISGLINLMFFAFESSCKISCSFGCWDFAVSFANNKIIQHNAIWRTLRRLGKIEERTFTRCAVCLMDKNCNSEIDFEALANIYCYAIKIRMLTDYENFFYKNPEFWNQIDKYFKKLKGVIDGQKAIETKCVEVEPT